MKRIIAVLLCLAVLVGFTLTGCGNTQTSDGGRDTSTPAASTQTQSTPSGDSGSTSGGKTKISVLRPGDEEKVAKFMEPAIKKFMEANPDIEVEIVYESWGGWIQKYPTLFESNTQPDVIFWWDNKQFDSSVAGKLVRLNDYLDKDLLAKIPQSVWDMVAIDDEAIYYVPATTDVFVLMYNKDVFKSAGLDPNNPPKTWDELLAACEAINKTGIPAIGVPAKTGMETLQEFVTNFVVCKTGKDMIDENNQPTFNTPEGLEAMEYIAKLFKYAQPSATEFGRGELRPMLRDGKIGMILESAWAIPLFQEAFGENLDNSPIGFAPPPVPENGYKACWMGTNGWIATRQETAEASAKLINYLMSDEVQFEHHKAYGSIPIYEYELQQDFYKYEFWNTMHNVVKTYRLHGMLAKYSPTPAAFYSELEQVWQLLLGGQIDAQQAIDMAVEKVNAINARQN